MVSVASRLWDRVDRSGGPDACWPIGGAAGPNGYVVLYIGDGKQVGAHRLALALSEGVDLPPREVHADHLCHDPAACTGPECPHRRCCNSAHLAWRTAQQNNARSGSPSALNAVKTHCPAGHPYDAANTYVDRKGRRSCKPCLREAYRRWEARGGTRRVQPPKVCPECGATKPGRSFRKGRCGACDARARRAAAPPSEPKTHCVHGHEYTPANTRYNTKGARVCATCRRESYQRWQSRQRGLGDAGDC